jgi:hypothetical protein
MTGGTTSPSRQLRTAWRLSQHPRRFPGLPPQIAVHTHAAGPTVALQPDLQLTEMVHAVLRQAAGEHLLANSADCMDSEQSQKWRKLTNMHVYSPPRLSQTVMVNGKYVQQQQLATVVLEVPLPTVPAGAPAADSQQPCPGRPSSVLVMLVGTSRHPYAQWHSMAAKLAELVWANSSGSARPDADSLRIRMTTAFVAAARKGAKQLPADRQLPAPAEPPASAAELSRQAACAPGRVLQEGAGEGEQRHVPRPAPAAFTAAHAHLMAAAAGVEHASQLAAELTGVLDTQRQTGRLTGITAGKSRRRSRSGSGNRDATACSIPGSSMMAAAESGGVASGSSSSSAASVACGSVHRRRRRTTASSD